MGIRKTGSVTGEVTEVETPEGITVTASAGEWTPGDEAALAEEDTEDPAAG
jgi:hypothetical protein